MLYAFFLAIAIVYNWRKFYKERQALFDSLLGAKCTSQREMILRHHFYIFIFEAFLSFIVAHFITEKSLSIGILGLGVVYLVLLFLGYFLFRYFVAHLEKKTGLDLMQSFQQNLIKELRVNFALVLLPIFIYSIINLTFQENLSEEWGDLWPLGFVLHLLFVSVLTIICTVIFMLKVIPNREITEPEYLEIINRRLEQINMPGLRVRWIETDIKNAFVVGLKLLRFSNQTMFVGRRLREVLSLEEFDAVICHELGHVANRHIHKRVIELLKNFMSAIIGIGIIMILVIGISAIYWGEDATLHTQSTAIWSLVFCLTWFVFNYALFFDTIRSHEYEADAFAVMELGADLNAMKSALCKLTTPEELPEYLKSRTQKGEGSVVQRWIRKHFSTHPDILARTSFLEWKIAQDLPFNYYVSVHKKIKQSLGHVFSWKVLVPSTTIFGALMGWAVIKMHRGQELVVWISHAHPDEIKSNTEIIKNINTSPTLLGHSLMFYIVRRKDPELIDHFIEQGADKGKTLVYISQIKDYDLLQTYYTRLHAKLTNDEYFLVLMKSAQMNFTEGYRFLVNAKRFEDLNPSYKEDVSRIHKRNRRPAASVE